MNSTNEIKVRLRTVIGIIILLLLIIGMAGFVLYDRNSSKVSNTLTSENLVFSDQIINPVIDEDEEVEDTSDYDEDDFYIPDNENDLLTPIPKTKNQIEDTTESFKLDTLPSQSKTDDKTVKYEFTTADRMAVRGYAGVFKIYDITDKYIKFEYNHGWNKDTSTIDRKVEGTADLNNTTNLYEFYEDIDGRSYKLTIDYVEGEDIITLNEYWDGDHFGTTNLFK